MAKVEESTLSVLLERQGRTLTKIKSWEIDSDYITSTDGFTFACYSENESEFHDLELQPVKLVVSGAEQLVGRIDISDLGGDGSAITYSGRDYIADFVEDNIDTRLIFAEGMELRALLLEALAPHGVTEVVSDEDFAARNVRTGKAIKHKGKKHSSGKNHADLTIKDLKPDNGLGTYDYVNRVCARFDCTIQPTNDRRKILLSSPNYDQAPAYSLTRLKTGGGKNNIVTANRHRDFSSVPSAIWFTGTDTKSGETGTALSRKIDVSSSTRVFDPVIADILLRGMVQGIWDKSRKWSPGKCYRLLTYRDEASKTTSELEAAAFRSLYERLKEVLVYTCTVQGHTDPETGAVWSIDTMVNVNDEVCRVHEPMWIASRKLKFNATDGATTDLTMWRPRLFMP